MSNFVIILLLATVGAAHAQLGIATKVFDVKGVVEKVEPAYSTVVIRHEAIPNYMPAMVMPFEVEDTNILTGLKPGDAVQFHLVVGPVHGWIDRILRLPGIPDASSMPEPSIHITHALAPLDEGDMAPDYHFTNELGQPVHLAQFKGQTVALTFFFTSCPFPDFCPRMTANFATADHLLERAHFASPWHLLSISFDPVTDTPAHLQAYAKGNDYNPGHWSFLTGDPAQIQALADQVGENYWREGSSIGHNLRTLVIDPTGRIRKILPGNKWTPEQLVNVMAAK